MTEPEPVYQSISYKGWTFHSGPMTQEQADRMSVLAMLRSVMERMADVEDPGMIDVDTLLAAAHRAELTVDVYLGPPDLPTAYVQDKDEATGRAMRDHTLTTRVRALPHRDWARLVAAHPPREDNATDRRRVVNMSTFFYEVVPLCLPDLTAAQFEKLDALISEGEWDKLSTAVWAVNTGSVDVPFSRNGSPTSPTSDET